MSAVKATGPRAIRLSFDDFEVDFGARTLKRADQFIFLDAETFDLLTILIASAPEPVREADLVEFLWPGTPIESSNLGKHIFLLRRALGGAARGERIIVATADQGYRFTAMLERKESEETDPEDDSPLVILDAENASEERAHPPASERKTARSRRQEDQAAPHLLARLTTLTAPLRQSRRLLLVVASAAAVIIATVVLLLIWPRFHAQSRPPIHLIVAGIQNSTLDPQFDASLRTALTADLRQSPHLILLSDGRIVASLVKLNTAPADGARATRLIPQQLCRLLKGDAYLSGELRRLGQKYLIVLSIHDCARAQEIATARGIADSPQHLIGILDRAALSLRSQLGESSKTLDSFRQPLFPGSASLPALKAYAEGVALALDKKNEDAITLLRRAVSIDARFPLAEEALGLLQLDTADRAEGAAHLTRAYQLRNFANAYDRLEIESRYEQQVTGDLIAAIRTAREAAEDYPSSSDFLLDLADLQDRTGKSTLALAPARQAIALDRENPRAYEVLAASQMHLEQFDEAILTCRHAISHNIDTPQIHSILLQIAFQRLDQPGIDEQVAWGQAHPEESAILIDQAAMELAQGKANSAQQLFRRALATVRQQGTSADRLEASIARRLAELGLSSAARAQLAHLQHPAEFPDAAIAWAELGDSSRASAMIDEAIAAHSSSTLLQQIQAPQLRAAIALREHDPQQAIEALQTASAYDRVSFDLPLMRGRALLAAHRPEEAEAEFHKILDHPGIDPFSQDYPLAQLNLARALAAEGKTTDAGFAYKLFLAIWKDGDSDLASLREARAEYSRLNSSSAAFSRSHAY